VYFRVGQEKYQDLIHLWQDSLYVSTQFSIHHVYCEKQEVYWQVYGRCVYGILQLRRIPSMSGHMSVYSAYTRRMKGYTEGGVDGMCTDFVYLMDNGYCL